MRSVVCILLVVYTRFLLDGGIRNHDLYPSCHVRFEYQTALLVHVHQPHDQRTSYFPPRVYVTSSNINNLRQISQFFRTPNRQTRIHHNASIRLPSPYPVPQYPQCAIHKYLNPINETPNIKRIPNDPSLSPSHDPLVRLLSIIPPHVLLPRIRVDVTEDVKPRPDPPYLFEQVLVALAVRKIFMPFRRCMCDQDVDVLWNRIRPRVTAPWVLEREFGPPTRRDLRGAVNLQLPVPVTGEGECDGRVFEVVKRRLPVVVVQVDLGGFVFCGAGARVKVAVVVAADDDFVWVRQRGEPVELRGDLVYRAGICEVAGVD